MLQFLDQNLSSTLISSNLMRVDKSQTGNYLFVCWRETIFLPQCFLVCSPSGNKAGVIIFSPWEKSNQDDGNWHPVPMKVESIFHTIFPQLNPVFRADTYYRKGPALDINFRHLWLHFLHASCHIIVQIYRVHWHNYIRRLQNHDYTNIIMTTVTQRRDYTLWQRSVSGSN